MQLLIRYTGHHVLMVDTGNLQRSMKLRSALPCIFLTSVISLTTPRTCDERRAVRAGEYCSDGNSLEEYAAANALIIWVSNDDEG